MNLLNIISFCLSVVAYSLKELQAHGKIRWANHPSNFWWSDSWIRKYKIDPKRSNQFIPAPDNWYYKLFKITYKEIFPLSATALVFLTDGYHLMQFCYKVLFIVSLVTYEPIFNMVWDFIIYFVGFGVVFSLTYKLASK